MTRKKLEAVSLTAADFAPYGDVIEVSGTPDKIINQGMCGRYHDLAALDFVNGRAGLSLFDAEARHLPLVVDMVERHPKGSQSFIPVSGTPFLIIVAENNNDVPVNLRAFITDHEQAINLHRNVWHGVLTPINAPGRFVVVDRIAADDNLEEHWFDDPYVVENAI